MQQAAGCWRELRKIKGGKLHWDTKFYQILLKDKSYKMLL